MSTEEKPSHILTGLAEHFATEYGKITAWPQVHSDGQRTIMGRLETTRTEHGPLVYPMIAQHPRGSMTHVRFGDYLIGYVSVELAKSGEFADFYRHAEALAATDASDSAFLHLAETYREWARISRRTFSPEADRDIQAGRFPCVIPPDTKASASSAKPRPSLVPAEALAGAVEALGLGASKYGANNWREIPDDEFARLYRDAFLRHVISAWSGEALDPESGRPHLDHALACLLLMRARGVELLRGGA